ncbi:hypothetical protein [Candidatus Leptofilum sp.]|uniref:hypothetical protein n=1 Tax=Candidatus Leptofilum sp. TaxID=3241576 RepID=UPI003B59A986
MSMKAYEEIFASDLSEADKIAKGFHHIISTIITHSQNEIELLKAMNDREHLIKEQIKLSTIQHAKSIFEMAYQRATGKRSQSSE